MKKYDGHYDGVVFFDTFPVRESAVEETEANIAAFDKCLKLIDEIGMGTIDAVVSSQDGVRAQKLILDMIR